MKRFLALETSTKVCSVALFEDEVCCLLKESDDLDYDHAENLHPFIEEALAELNWEIGSLDAIAVSSGPGSYTGLRIGVAAAKGLCFALNKPLIAINPLRIMMEMCLQSKKILLPEAHYIAMLDARRREVYWQSFSETGEPLSDIETQIIDADHLVFSTENYVCFGPGADKFAEDFEKVVGNNIPGVYPSAQFMGKLVFNKFKNQEFEDLAYFEPFYLKDFVAIKAKPKFNRRNT